MVTEQQNTNTTEQPEFGIQRLYVKDLSFEAPGTPGVFKLEWKPELNIELHTESHVLESDIHEVVLSVTCTVKSNAQVAFLAEVKYAGIFTVKNFTKEQSHQILGSVCPTILFPYIREIISDMVTRASFPQLILAPVNFDAIYQQQLQKNASPIITEEGTGSKH